MSMEPVVTLSPSASPFHRPSPRGSGDTTPKLPRRERLASFSRLIASDSFAEFFPNKSPRDVKGNRKLTARDWDIETPSIQISPSTPLKKEHSKPWNQSVNGYLDSYQLPFSPTLLNCKSPKYLSPNYRRPTPTKSPLYKSDQRSLFLGRGSFGNVSLCIYKGSKFALKVTRNKSYVGEKNFLHLRHPHLVAILHISQVLDKVCICMEFAGHCNLQQVLDTKSELDFPRRLSFCLQILSGLRHCHQHNIVHADVKPANVIVSPHGICKLGDFGHSIVHLLESASQGVLPGEDVVGTVAYAAPEVLRGARPTPASDMHSYGILLWQVESRELPFAGEHPHVILYKVAHYGARPKFFSDGDQYMDIYVEVAKLCWHAEASKRLTAPQAHDMLQEIRK